MMKFQKISLNTLILSECFSTISLIERVMMVFSFLIGTLIFFMLNLISNLMIFSIEAAKGNASVVSTIIIILSVCMLTWNILALTFY